MIDRAPDSNDRNRLATPEITGSQSDIEQLPLHGHPLTVCYHFQTVTASRRIIIFYGMNRQLLLGINSKEVFQRQNHGLFFCFKNKCKAPGFRRSADKKTGGQSRPRFTDVKAGVKPAFSFRIPGCA
ncbi:MAG: hypothetical protein LBE24_05770 [Methylobacillus sp.]|nr:hypothetical protein [Methylobacillus sp.]